MEPTVTNDRVGGKGNTMGTLPRTLATMAVGCLLLLGAALLPTTAMAQLRHGGRIQKECCVAGTGGTSGVPCQKTASVGQSLDCDIIVTNIDGFDDTLTVNQVRDEIDHASCVNTAPACNGTCPAGGTCAPSTASANDCTCVFPLYEGEGPALSGVSLIGRCAQAVPGGPGTNQKCMVTANCTASGERCFNGVCVPVTGKGTPCAANSDCTAATCARGQCTNANTACSRDDCPNGSCVAGTCVGGCPSGTCVGGVCSGGTRDGGSCPDGRSCAVDNCPNNANGPGACALLLPHPLLQSAGLDGAILEVSHTSAVQAGDELLDDLDGNGFADLVDFGAATGFDLGTFREYGLQFPSAVQVPPVEGVGCRITGGGRNPDGSMDLGIFAEIQNGSFGGQVGAPCGCIGCFPLVDDRVQGSWTYKRKSKKGTLHAKTYNSLVCGCDGVMNGEICEGDGPAPPRAPANMACFSGVADFNPTSGNRTVPVAFRIEVIDRGEPGKDDIINIRIWVPRSGENAESLAAEACCTLPTPTARQPDINDGVPGTLLSGNIQIHRVTPHGDVTCPVPRETCP